MPPKKRPASAAATTSTSKRKKVSIGATSVMGELDTAEIHASGRPKRSSIGEPTYNPTAAKKSAIKTATATRGRGRPRKDAAAPNGEQQASATPTQPPGKSVGRPKKSAAAKFTRVKSHPPAKTTAQALKKTTRSPKSSAVAPTTKPRGRPKSTTTKGTAVAPTPTQADKVKSKPKATKAESHEELDGLTANESDWDEGHEDEGKQYWLMKAEPESRLENGVDVKFSIDDLMRAEEPEGWDGMTSFVFRSRDYH